MKAIDKWLEPDLPEDQDDRLTEKFVARQVEETYRQSLREKLDREYGVSKNAPLRTTARTFRLTGWKAWVSVAAAVLVCFIGLKVFLPSGNPEVMAMQYIEEQTFFHAGTTKGIVSESQVREQMQRSFNEKQYEEAIALLLQISQPTEEDKYYHALALMLGSKSKEAIPIFNDLTTSGSQYAEASTWYKAISLMLNKQTTEALVVLRSIKPEEWNYALAQQYIRKLD